MEGSDGEDTIASQDYQYLHLPDELVDIPKWQSGKGQRKKVLPLPEILETPKRTMELRMTKSSKNYVPTTTVLPAIIVRSGKKSGKMFRGKRLSSRNSDIGQPLSDERDSVNKVEDYKEWGTQKVNTAETETDNVNDAFEESREDDENKKRMIKVVIEQPEMESDTQSVLSISSGPKVQKGEMCERKISVSKHENKQMSISAKRCSSAPPAIYPLKYLPNLFIMIKKKKKVKKKKKATKKLTTKPLPRNQPVKIKPSPQFQQKPQRNRRNKTKKFKKMEIPMAKIEQVDNISQQRPRRGSNVPTQVEKHLLKPETVCKTPEDVTTIPEETELSPEDIEEYNKEMGSDTESLIIQKKFTEEEIRQLSEKYFSKLRDNQTVMAEENRNLSVNISTSGKFPDARSPMLECNLEKDYKEEPWSERIWRLVVMALQEPLALPTEKTRTHRARSVPTRSSVVQPVRSRRSKSLPTIDIKSIPLPVKPERIKKKKKLGEKVFLKFICSNSYFISFRFASIEVL